MENLDAILQKFINEMQDTQTVELKDIPNIDLYMDQVTTFMDSVLAEYKRYPDDKILTKTMINNYAKARIFPPPVKKKYTKNHLILLIIIYHLKTVLSIHDISILLKPVTDELLTNNKTKLLDKIYVNFVAMQKMNKENLQSVLSGNYEMLQNCKEHIEDFSDNRMQLILLVLLLSIQANTEKRLAEKLLDSYF
ncbi:MAG: DUF1836 domain-containing protein [Epulopiscium sp.]|nr:DUF1836 domain-containing protein [Candidatus Epulonipiscium sp.]